MARQIVFDYSRLVDALASTYAEALFEVANAQDVAVQVSQELEAIVELLDVETGADASLRTLLTSGAINPAKREDSIKKIFGESIHVVTLNLLFVLNKKGRMEALTGIYLAFDRKVRMANGEIDAFVTSARELSESQLATITESLSKLQDSTARVHAQVDPSLLGGIKVRVGDSMIDASLATQMKQVQKQLKEKGRQLVAEKMDALLDYDASDTSTAMLDQETKITDE